MTDVFRSRTADSVVNEADTRGVATATAPDVCSSSDQKGMHLCKGLSNPGTVIRIAIRIPDLA